MFDKRITYTPVGVALHLAMEGCPMDEIGYWTRLMYGRSRGSADDLERVFMAEVYPYIQNSLRRGTTTKLGRERPLTVDEVLSLRGACINAINNYRDEFSIVAVTGAPKSTPPQPEAGELRYLAESPMKPVRFRSEEGDFASKLRKVSRVAKLAIATAPLDPATKSMLATIMNVVDATVASDPVAAAVPMQQALVSLANSEQGDVLLANAAYGEPDAKKALKTIRDFYATTIGAESPAVRVLDDAQRRL